MHETQIASASPFQVIGQTKHCFCIYEYISFVLLFCPTFSIGIFIIKHVQLQPFQNTQEYVWCKNIIHRFSMNIFLSRQLASWI